MGTWADHAIETLATGRRVQLRPRGGSMTPYIRSGQRVTIEPVGERPLRRGDIVLVSMSARTVYLHLVHAVDGDRVQVANARGHVNGWASTRQVHGRVVTVED